jgi:Uma2 family endonuclease
VIERGGMPMVAVKQLTVDDLDDIDLGDGRYELIDGELVEMTPAGGEHGDIGAGALARLWFHVRERRLGKVFNADAGFSLAPKLVHCPDAAFVRADRLPPKEQMSKILRLAPDLVVEVVSPTDRPAKVARKVEDWLAAGVRLLWLFRPRDRTITVYAPGRPPVILRESDTLDGGDVLPDFRVAVADLFP